MEQSFPAVEPHLESPRASLKQINVEGSHWNDSAGVETPSVTTSPASSDSHIHLGDRMRLLLTVVTATTSCTAGEGEVRSKTTRRTRGEDHGERTLDILIRYVTRRVSSSTQQTIDL